MGSQTNVRRLNTVLVDVNVQVLEAREGVS